MAEYDSAIALAIRLINKKGRTLTLRRFNNTPEDSSKPWRNSVTNFESIDDKDVKGVVVDYSLKDIDGKNIKQGDKSCVIAAEDQNLVIENYNQVVDKNIYWHIVYATIVEPGNQRIVYKLQLRK